MISWIERWYLSQCDGDWEHSQVIRISTLDNPGWSVSIDLKDTSLENLSMEKLSRDKGTGDWIVCEIRDTKFVGHGDPLKLSEILNVFKSWAERSTS